jgi:NarL family two-component system response regulator LiaR
MIRILLVDDDSSVRIGLRMRLELEADMEVIGEGENGVDALKLADDLNPDVIIMDVEMDKMDGIEATKRISDQYPSISVIMLSIHGDPKTKEGAKAAGAISFIEKKGTAKELIKAIRKTTLLSR